MNNLNSILDYLKVFNNINKRPAYEPRTMAQGGRIGYDDGQLVRNTVDGSRPGYAGDDVAYKTEKWLKDPGFKKFYKNEKKGTSKWDAKQRYDVLQARKNKIVGIRELSEALGESNPYSLKSLTHSWGYKNTKITKNMSRREKMRIKNGNKIIKMINEALGEPTSLVSVHRKPGQIAQSPVWDLNPSKIKKLNKLLTKNYHRVGELQEKTLDNIFNLHDNTKLMKAIDNYKGGKIKPGDSILKLLAPEFKKSGVDPSYGLMQLARALRGEIEIEGIGKDLKRGNRIIKMLAKHGKSQLGNGFLSWAKLQMGKHFDDPNADYGSLTRSLKKSMKQAGITDVNLHIDEIFPARTGQLTIGKGSGAYNHVIQLIDGKINEGVKANFDSLATPRYKSIIAKRRSAKAAEKIGDVVKADKLWGEVNNLVKDHDDAIKNFYEANPQAKGKVKLTKLNYDPKTKTFASPTEIYGKDVFPSKIQKDMDEFYRKTGLSLDVGSTMTLEKTAKDLEKVTGDPKAQMKILQKLGFGKHCKASGGRVGFKDAGDVGAGQMNCIMDDVKKTRADMKSSSVEVRAKALTKQRKALQLAKQIPKLKNILKTGVQLGTAAITKPLEWLGLTSGLGYAIEGLVEGGFYDNARRKGYSHEQAMAETLTPGLLAGRPHDVPWYGGSEKLREKELYEVKGRNEFIDVENRPPMQDPEFEKVIGTKGKVKQYVDALEEQDRIYEAIGAKEQAKKEAGLAETGFDATLLPADLDAASADVQDLARSGAYGRVDRTMNPESMASQAYNTAVENRDALDQRRRTEYLEKVEPRFLEREQKAFDTKRHRDKRYTEMKEKFPGYSDEQIDEILAYYETSQPKVGMSYGELGKMLDTGDKQAYYADNFRMEKAQGGIMNLKKKW
jgi:hypothetical protein